MGTAQVLRQLASEAEREQQEQLSLRAVNADLLRRLSAAQTENQRLLETDALMQDQLAENARIQRTVDEDREEISALRNVLRRERVEKKELQEKLKRADQVREAAVHEAALAKTAHAESEREKRRAEADLAQVEWERDTIIDEVETDAGNRISQAEDEAGQSRDEIRVMAVRLQRQRRRAQRAESERDQLRLQGLADTDAIYNLRVELDARSRD
jgi:hypothetical protein